MNQKEAS